MLPPPEFNSFTLNGLLREREGESKKNTKPILLLSKTLYFFLIKAFKLWRRLTLCSCDQNLLSHPPPLRLFRLGFGSPYRQRRKPDPCCLGGGGETH